MWSLWKTIYQKNRTYKEKSSTSDNQFRSLYIVEINKACQICHNIKPLSEKIELYILRKHLGRAAKEFAQTF